MQGFTRKLLTLLALCVLVMLFGVAASAAATSYQVLRIGDSGQLVVTLQKALNEQGYFNTEVTGNYGSVTRSAVISFQKANGLTTDGIAGSATQNKLYAVSAPAGTEAAATPQPTATATPATVSYKLLKKGDSGTLVSNLQTALKTLGFFNETVTGNYGSVTYNSVIAFQKEYKFTADGVAGPITLQALYEKAGTTSTPDATEPEDVEVQITIEANSYQTLKLGDSNKYVTQLQMALKQLSFFTANATGNYGSITRASVVAFQMKYSLNADGVAGPITLQKVYGLYDVNTVNDSSGTDTTSGDTAATGVEKADWFTVVKGVWKTGETATVTDVRTGIVFTVKRVCGTNHADFEPVDAASTAALKSAYNGVWSWDRRPVWVAVHDRTFAASMNGQPHGGTDFVPYNNMNGVLCMHFLNSRTHGTNQVCPLHQASVEEAYQAVK